MCAASKSPDLLHWWCSSCHRSTALRSGSFLSGKKITFVNFVHLLFWFSVKGLGDLQFRNFLVWAKTLSVHGGRF